MAMARDPYLKSGFEWNSIFLSNSIFKMHPFNLIKDSYPFQMIIHNQFHKSNFTLQQNVGAIRHDWSPIKTTISSE